MSVPRGALALLLLGLLGWHSPAVGQSLFGKNKVHYDRLDWHVLETPHVRLHYYAEEESLARETAALAESTCVEYDRRFRLQPKQRVPLLLYSTHHLFQQSNATPEMISEGVGGLTELIKGRVLIPYTGSWRRLVWVTRHELTHAYMLDKITRVLREHKKSQVYLPPLWFTEGLAEFCGTTWDAEAEGLLRDAAVSGRALPLKKIEPIEGTVLMYKEGQSFLLWLAEEYGNERVFDLLDGWYRADEFEALFKLILGESLLDADERWFESVKRRYYPTIATRSSASDAAQRITQRGRFNLGVRALPSRDPSDTALRFVYFEATEGATDLMRSEMTPKGRRTVRLLRGGLSPRFESFHLFQNRPGVSPSGALAVVSKRGGQDAIHVLNSQGQVERTLSFTHLVAINAPALAPGDTAVVFSAQDRSGQSDLYRARWGTGSVALDRLTRDSFDDLDPTLTPDGRFVWFSSDRSSEGGRYALHRLSLDTGRLEPMSQPPRGDDRQPVVSPDGRWLLFRSTRDGSSDLFLRSAEGGAGTRRVTRLLGPALDPDWAGNRRVVFTAEQGVEFQVYALPVEPESLPVEPESLFVSRPLEPASRFQGEPEPYQRRLGFDLVQNGFAVDPGLGAAGAGQVALSDVLGNEQIYLFLANDSERFGNFWDGFEGGVTYLNQSQRLNYGLGLFRLTQVYDADLDVVRREKRAGLVALARYPFSKFTRMEGSLLLRHASDHLLRRGDFQDVDLVSNFMAWVHDDARWTWLGPAGGSRIYLGGGFTRDLTSGAGDFGTLVAELRHYRQPLPLLLAATRLQGQMSLGPDAQRFYLGGGAAGLRGYDRRSLSGVHTALVSEELRFPLLRGLVLGFPTAWQFPTVSGALFADMAWADDGGRVERAGGVGAGVYLGGGYFPALRWNFVWRTLDFHTFALQPVTQFTIGFNY